MVTSTRSSARIASLNSSQSASQSKSPPKAAGKKHKGEAGSPPAAKRGKNGPEKEQKTIEETMTGMDQPIPDAPKVEEALPVETEDVALKPKTNGDSSEHAGKATAGETISTDEKKDDEPLKANGAERTSEATSDKHETADRDTKSEKAQANGAESTSEAASDKHEPGDRDTKSEKAQANDAGARELKEDKDVTEVSQSKSAVEPEIRDDETPSSILEKGIIYFLFRGRVNIEDPQGVNDVARSYMVMRPLPHGAKLGDGPIGDEGNCRLLALPKKVLPLSGKDKFMIFVEKTKTTFKDLKDNVLSGSDYATQTAGTRHTPSTTPIAEGVYAIASTGRESHLAYIITIPAELGEVQTDMGLRERGSFVTSAKNPQYAGPANATLPKGPEYPTEILDEFRSLRWMPLQPKLLDYENAQFLLIGESQGLDQAMQPQEADEKMDKETPMEEMEKLESEDEIRVSHLNGNDAVFTDLGLSHREFSKIPSTW